MENFEGRIDLQIYRKYTTNTESGKCFCEKYSL